MALNWIKVEDFSFNCFLLMETFQIKLMCGWHHQKEWKTNLGIALAYNPAVKWYFIHKCPESAAFVEEVTSNVPDGLSSEEVRNAELLTMAGVEDFVTYTRPEIMDSSCDFIYAWDKKRLFELADLTDKLVLDVGSGSGRLAFAASEQARQVYASEPVDTLRHYLREKINRLNIKNIRVLDGMAHCLPYPDDTFDIVMSGHVVGDDYDAEIAELTRVVKSGGWLLDCPGEDPRRCEPRTEMLKRGWEELYYTSTLGGDVYRYRKQIFK